MILDFSSETFRFRIERNSFILGISSNSNNSLLLLVTTKSSTYLVTQQPVNFFPKVVLCDVTPCRTTYSKPFREILHNNGDITPP
jgi:hypothetical protein